MNALKMNNAISSARRGGQTKLMVIQSSRGEVEHKLVSDLSENFERGDIVVVNDAATLPASLMGRFRNKQGSFAVELRLVQNLSKTLKDLSKWRAVIFGEGDWRIPTEKRKVPPPVERNEILDFGSLKARVVKVEKTVSPRLLEIEFLERGPRLWWLFYQVAKPIQYSYLKDTLHLWDQQTLFAGPPVALEPPSASFALTWQNLINLEAKGVEVLKITHSTGISNTGDEAIDRLLPFPERSFISESVQEPLKKAQREGRRIIAVGTGVVRALEKWAQTHGKSESFVADNRVTAGSGLKLVTGLLTGFHEPQGSHVQMLSAFVDQKILLRSYEVALERGYLWHEYGDLCLII